MRGCWAEAASGFCLLAEGFTFVPCNLDNVRHLFSGLTFKMGYYDEYFG